MDEFDKLLSELEAEADAAANRGDTLEHARLDERWYKLALLAVDIEDAERQKRVNKSLMKRLAYLDSLEEARENLISNVVKI